VESRFESRRENINALQVERFYTTTINKETGVEKPRDQSNNYKDEHFYVYTEAGTDMSNSNLYMYSIVSENVNTNVGLVILKRKPIYVVHSKYPDSE
jgi:hypothetical protein